MSILIKSGTSNWHERPPVLMEPEDDFDIYTLYPVVSAASINAACAQFDKGSTPSGVSGNFFCTEVTGSELVCGSGLFSMQVTCKGLAREKPAKYEINSYAERNSYRAVNTPAYALGPAPHDLSEPRLGLTVRYISADIPDTSVIGTAQTPPLSLDTPANIWDSITDTVFAFPYGWVLEKRTGPNIAGTTYYFVTDAYVYYQPVRPNS
jgi:hypothetical protein